MKRNGRKYLIIGLLTIALSAVSGCSFSQAPPEVERYLNGQKPAGYVTFTDASGTFSLSFPTDWPVDNEVLAAAAELPNDYFTVIEDKTKWDKIIDFDSRYSRQFFFLAGSEPAINLMVSPAAPMYSLPAIMDMVLKNFEGAKGYKLHSRSDFCLNGWQPAVLTQYTIGDNDYLQLTTRKQAADWWVTASCPSTKWNESKDDIYKSVLSFKRLK